MYIDYVKDIGDEERNKVVCILLSSLYLFWKAIQFWTIGMHQYNPSDLMLLSPVLQVKSSDFNTISKVTNACVPRSSNCKALGFKSDGPRFGPALERLHSEKDWKSLEVNSCKKLHSPSSFRIEHKVQFVHTCIYHRLWKSGLSLRKKICESYLHEDSQHTQSSKGAALVDTSGPQRSRLRIPRKGCSKLINLRRIGGRVVKALDS